MVDPAAVGGVVLALVLVVLNGFFVASEFAFVRVRSTSVEQLVEEGRTGSAALQDVMDDLDDYLAVTNSLHRLLLGLLEFRFPPFRK